MGKMSDQILEDHKSFIEKQHLFFVSTAPLSEKGHINLSPKGLDSFRVLSSNRVVYMDIIGSGNETSAHILENGRITFMFCAFDGLPKILRLYGQGRTVLPGEPEWEELSANFKVLPSVRQFIVADITQVQTSCGFGVPYYEYKGDREHSYKWAENKGAEVMEAYKAEKNMVSMDGLPTALAEVRQH